MLKRYVVGLLFDEALNEVLLIRKKRPTWMAGLLNGIGGLVEENETPGYAMARECHEETTLQISDWEEICHIYLERVDLSLFFFTAVGDLSKAVQNTDEELEIFKVKYLGVNEVVDILADLLWLIPMAKYVLSGKGNGATVQSIKLSRL